MSRVNQYPALGGSRGVSYNQAEMSKDLQVYHLTSKHHPNGLYDGISNNFVQSIETQANPSLNYSAKMKNIYMDELDNCLNDYKTKKTRTITEAEHFRNDYKENVNTLILYMEKEGDRRKKYISDYMKQQEARQARFIDGDKIRNQKIEQFINNNEFPNLLTKSILMNQGQIPNCSQNNSIHNAVNQMMRQSDNYSPVQQQYTKLNSPSIPLKQQLPYQMPQQLPQIPKLPIQNILNKQQMEMNRSNVNVNSTSNNKIFRVHNPITNPIQYHIDNPYFVSKMQRKYGSQCR